VRHEIALRNEKLAESYDRLAELDRLKSEFFANVSHELRTPLTLILSPMEDLVRRSGLSESDRDLLKVVKGNALRLLKLINDLLELVRLEEGRAELEFEPVELNTFVPGIVASVKHLATKKGLELTAAGTDQPLVVQADPGRLEKILLNLFINAIKFTPTRGRVSVHWRRDGGAAVVEVVDSGIGISEKDLPFIFDRFRPADGSSTRKHGGVGIGLALARELAEKHTGRLEAESKLGRGTTMRVKLPLAGPVESQTAKPDAQAETHGSPEGPVTEIYRAADRTLHLDRREQPRELPVLGAGNHTVLLVEDEPDLRSFLATALAAEYRVMQAADGESGLELIRRCRPELVLLDLMLPRMDGLDVREAVKKDEALRNTKVILLTARSDEAAKITALERGADDFLIKPFSTVEVKTRMTNLLHEAQLKQELSRRNDELEDALARLKQVESQLVQTEKMNALGNLASGLLHEINNPLNYTLAALQLAEEAVTDDEDLQETLDDIGQGMARIRDIVSDLKSSAYPSPEDMQEEFELAACLDTALRLAAHEIGGIAVYRDLPGTCAVLGSKTQVTHLLLNVLTNSAQALSQGDGKRSPEIRV
jgi:signal transduction histidine kinase